MEDLESNTLSSDILYDSDFNIMIVAIDSYNNFKIAFVQNTDIVIENVDATLEITELPIGTWTDIPLNTERVKDTDFTHAANAANITFNTAGRYSVTARCSTFITSGSTRSQCQMRIMLDTGVGFTQIPGAIGFMYSKEVTEGYNTATVNLDKSTFSFSIVLDFSTFLAGLDSVLTGLASTFTDFSTFFVFLAEGSNCNLSNNTSPNCFGEAKLKRTLAC